MSTEIDESELSKMTTLAAADPTASLRNYRLLESLRTGDSATITTLLSEIAKEEDAKNAKNPAEPIRASTPLHLAVRCAKFPTVELVSQRCPRYLNACDARGQTPLHLAAALNRADVVSLLVGKTEIDDAVLNDAGLSALEVSVGHEVSNILSVSRAHHNEKFIDLLSQYIASPASDAAPSITSSTAAAASVSAASGHVSNSEAEKLYHFILRPRARIIDFSAQDPNTGTTLLHEASKRKDLGLIKLLLSRGADVMAIDRKGKVALEIAKDERIRAVLKSAAESVEEGGGATNLGPPPSMRGFLSKWTNMARGYRSRWFVLDNGTLSYYRTQDEEGKASRGSINMSVAIIHSPAADALKFEVSSKLGKSYPSFWLKANHHSEATKWVDALRKNVEYAKEPAAPLSRTGSGGSAYAHSIAGGVGGEGGRRGSVRRRERVQALDTFGDRDGSILGDDETSYGDDDGGAPRADDFELLATSAKTQIELTQQLLSSLTSTAGDQKDVKDALDGSLKTLGSIFEEYVDVVAQRERYFNRKFEKEIEIKRLWEQSMKDVAAQHAKVEAELERFGRDNVRKTKALHEVRANLTGSPVSTPSVVHEGHNPIDQLPEQGGLGSLPPPLQTLNSNARISRSRASTGNLSPTRSRLRSATITHALNPIELEQLVDSALAGEGDEDSEDDDEEFFEAIEAGVIPFSADLPAVPQAKPTQAFMDALDLTPYKGYENLRAKLPIDSDNRPPVSLWAILKGSIGKDLSKISFPVFFNEPTSMLQRMSEDLEFSECLDAAAAQSDPDRRIAYVAAFAMSNYSSTIGRIAKPFNPMLGETFEYVDLKKKYRYLSEQVSHHPPISACIAQAASWEYFGEVDAKSSFKGKSFEITPVGVAHVHLRIPKEWAPDLPPAPMFPGMVIEHYSWTKVTTSVSNFLFGNPIIDHFGEMVITNHASSTKCHLTFKPRGWRGSGATEIKGKVVDASGNESWSIAGKWSSQLVARRFGIDSGELAPDASIPPSTTSGGETAEYIRLWKNSDKPAGSPFNLTPFAITLNDANTELASWLPPTDCRIRPDQRNFEMGLYERANDLKTSLEDYQRTTRKSRTGEYAPRWFTRKVEKDTGEGFWEPKRVVGSGAAGGEGEGGLEYWDERKRVGLARKEGKEVEWKGVEKIFGNFA